MSVTKWGPFISMALFTAANIKGTIAATNAEAQCEGTFTVKAIHLVLTSSILDYEAALNLQSAPLNSTNPFNSTISSGHTPLTPYVKSNSKFNTLPNSTENLRILFGRIGILGTEVTVEVRVTSRLLGLM